MRLDDWPERLNAAFEALSWEPFDYGVHDCALHAAACADAITGGHIVEDWAGTYGDYAEGLRLLKARTGFRSLSAWAGSLWARQHPVMAQRGDWAMVRTQVETFGNPRLCFVVVDGVWLRGPCGVIVPRARALRAWRVE